jgi:hypothetical protein
MDLIQRTLNAALEESVHSQLCFEKARENQENEISLNRLPIPKRLRLHSVSDLVKEIVLDGCFNETLAAKLARRASQSSAQAGSVFDRIAREEAQHAELSWDLLSWARASYPKQSHRGIRTSLKLLRKSAPNFASMQVGATGRELPASDYERLYRETKSSVIERLESSAKGVRHLLM